LVNFILLKPIDAFSYNIILIISPDLSNCSKMNSIMRAKCSDYKYYRAHFYEIGWSHQSMIRNFHFQKVYCMNPQTLLMI